MMGNAIKTNSVDKQINMDQISPENISAHKQLKELLKNTREKINILERIILANPFPVAIWDKDGCFVTGNKGYKDMFMGRPPDGYSIFNDPIIQSWDVYPDFIKIKKGNILRFPAVPYNTRKLNPTYPDNPIWFETTISPITNDEDIIECYIFHYINVTEQKKLEQENLQLEQAVSEAKNEIKNIITLYEREKQMLSKEIISRLRNNIIPVIKKIKEKGAVTQDKIELIEKQFAKIPDNFYQKLITKHDGLTPSEIRICELLRSSVKRKDIAMILNISGSTVHSHIQNIRKKLKLKGREQQLDAYLQSLQ